MEQEVIKIKIPKPLNWQNDVYNKRKRFSVIMASRRIGKSVFTQRLVVEKATKGKRVLITHPTYKMSLGYYEQLEVLLKPIIQTSNKSDKIIQLITGGVIEMFSLDTTAADSIRGREYDLYVGDEAAFCSNLKDVWERIIRPTLLTRKGEAIFCSTPNGLNDFYYLYNRGAGENENWKSFKFTVYDAEHISRDEIEQIKSETTQAAFDQEYMCEIGSNQSNPFGNNIYKNLIEKLSTKPTKWYGIDLASTVDFTVIIGLDEDGNMSYFNRFQGDWDYVQDRIKELGTKVSIILDATGVGKVVLDMLRKEMPNVNGFIYTPASKKPLIQRLIKAVEMGEVKYIEQVANEMGVFEYRETVGGTKYNAISGYHDDCVNALALALNCKDKNLTRGKYNLIAVNNR